MNSNSRWDFATSGLLRALVALTSAAGFGSVAILGGVLVSGSLAVSTAEAQIVAAGMTGIVRTGLGQPVAGATVTATHLPTGTTYTTATRSNGRFDFRGMLVGGPYEVTVAAGGFKDAVRSGLGTLLGSDIEVNITLESTQEEVVMLEEFTVEAGSNELNAAEIGAGDVYGATQLGAKPTTQRSLADLVSASPLVTLRSMSGDREEAQITAVGQSNRYNSIQIDGARINDQFGLNGTGLASFFNPLSLESLEQLSVQVSPYDIRQAGFTGASVNAVTKSGTNEFHGTVYYYFSGDEFLGVQLQGKDVFGATKGVLPVLERTTWGATLGGPVIKDRLFFFANYEKFERTQAANNSGLPVVDSADLSTINAGFAALNSASGLPIDWGALGGSALNFTEDEKILAKLDWIINSAHRASVRYSTTEGSVPQFGRFTNATSNELNLLGGGTTAFDSHFYAQAREEKVWAAQLFSQWSPSLRTELNYSSTKQDQFTPVNEVAPEVFIFGVRGIDDQGRSISDGVLVAGTERFRQGNQINLDSKQMSVIADYYYENYVFTAGAEREESDFFNLFRQGSYGRVAYANPAAFLADTSSRFERNVFDPSLRPVGDVSDFATTGIFTQVKWTPNSRFTLLGGLRYEFQESSIAPAFNETLFATTGFRNDGTVDGASKVSPRLSFNWAADGRRNLQIRGGIGHFLGRAPWVFFSNSYNNIGVGSFTQIASPTAPATTLPAGFMSSYLRDEFDPSNPIGTAADSGTGRREVNWTDDEINVPSVWRGNVAFDVKVSFLDSIVSVEAVRTKTDEAMFITNENLKPTTAPAADGRLRFAGNLSTAANALYPGYTDLYRISNVSRGNSTYFTFSWLRPVKDTWGFDLAYTRGDSNEAQAIGQTTASGQWQRNVVFNQSEVEVGTSDFEVKDRIQLTLTKEFMLRDGWKTAVSLYYEGRTGNPFSWVYSSDLNGDGRSDNDTVAVPSGPDDPRFDFSGMSNATAYLAFIGNSDLSAYAGGVAPKNAFTEPWVNRLDLKFSQEIPVYASAKLELFLDFINFGAFVSEDFFGYVDRTSRLSNDVFRTRQLGGARYGSDGRIQPTFGTPDQFVTDNVQSRWRIQLGARLSF